MPARPKDTSYEDAVQLLRTHLSPQQSVIAEWCKFNHRSQKEGESVEDVIVTLKDLARKCDYGAFLSEALRDRWVAGLQREEAQRALFTAEDLTFEKACKIAREHELAESQTKMMHSETRNVGQVNQVRDQQRQKQGSRQYKRGRASGKTKVSAQQQCCRCGKPHHPVNCWYKNYKCNKCSKVGHLKVMCKYEDHQTKTNFVEASDDESVDSVFQLQSSSDSQHPYKVCVEVEGSPLSMLADTGASVSIMPQEVYKKPSPHLKCKPSNVNLKAHSGEQLPC